MPEHTNTLERNLGLLPALAIGVGTMVGAGVFVFPGLAGGQAGAGATISFVLAGGIAALVALCTAELATAMPQSGGGYFFISRVMGVRLGTLVGLGQTIGLIFATAFYLAGFAEYVLKLLAEFNVDLALPVYLLGGGMAILLLLLNFMGTEKVGQAQNYVVAGLLIILLTLFGYGLLKVLGVTGPPNLPESVTPRGVGAIFTTTALVFTSFLGFVQIATVAGEIRTPYKTLPRSLVGSVVVATAIYALVVFVTTSLFPAEKLAEMGETATVEVGRNLVGFTGAMAILIAGLLATLSSANASILSASRTVYALGRDALLPERTGKLHPKYNTPHVALLIIGIPMVACLFIGRIEVLAEVASLLHLILYGLICITLILCRRRRELWYAPTFRIPGFPVVPAMGALTCFGLIALMEPLSIGIGAGAVALSFGWYWFYDRGKEVGRPQPAHIAPEIRRPHILLPVAIDEEGEGDLPSFDLLDNFSRLEVFVLGYRVIPEQTSPQQAREQVGDGPKERLDKALNAIPVAETDIESDLAYTSDPVDLLENYAREHHCQAILLPAGIERVDRLVLPLSRPAQFGLRLVTVLRELADTRRRPLLLLLLETEEESHWDDDFESRARALVARAGISSPDLTVRHAGTDHLIEALEQELQTTDLIILREREETDRYDLLDHLRDDIEAPALIVLENQPTEDDE
jgi:amino acid transporter/RNA-binding protein YhbY